MVDRLKSCDYVIHFKHETDTADHEMKYVYKIVGFAIHTETEEKLVVYKNTVTGVVYARPYDMFMSEVDHKEYPEIKQKYRFEKWKASLRP